YWSERINQCMSEPPATGVPGGAAPTGWSFAGGSASGSTPLDCLHARRIDVAAAFFVEQEFQQTGSFIYDLYQGALGRRPLFAEYSSDRQQVVGGANLDAEKSAFVENFAHRAEFVGKYQADTTAESFVDTLIQSVQTSAFDLS